MMIADTSVWIDYLNQRRTPWARVMDRFLDEGRLGLPDLIMYEVLAGIRHDAKFEAALARCRACTILATMSEEVAVRAASNYRYLRRRGITVRSTTDTLVATVAIMRGYILLHNDHDFDHFEAHLGLRVFREY